MTDRSCAAPGSAGPGPPPAAAAALTQHVAPAARLPGCRGSVISVCREWRDVFCGLEGVWSHYQLTVGVGRMQKSSTAAAEWAEGTRSLLQRVAAHGCISSASIQARQGTCCSHLPAGWLLEDCLARLDPAVLLRLSLLQAAGLRAALRLERLESLDLSTGSAPLPDNATFMLYLLPTTLRSLRIADWSTRSSLGGLTGGIAILTQLTHLSLGSLEPLPLLGQLITLRSLRELHLATRSVLSCTLLRPLDFPQLRMLTCKAPSLSVSGSPARPPAHCRVLLPAHSCCSSVRAATATAV